MPYKETKIEVIAEKLKGNRDSNKKTAILIGAGVSDTAGIPLAGEIMKRIKEKFPEACKHRKCQTYGQYMDAISPSDRKELITEYIENSKLNASHLYLAALIRDGYVDRVLTTNFDPLVIKTLALENIFPGVYDFVASETLVFGEAAEKSVFYLHGQYDGFAILNTDDEVNKHYDKLKPVFDDSLINRTIIIVGYSGENDPVFRHLTEIHVFNNELYWIGFNDKEPTDKIKELLNKSNNRSFYLKGYDADNFFIELSGKLQVKPPRIISTPFSYLKEVVDDIAEIKVKDKVTDPAKEARGWIQEAIDLYEKGEMAKPQEQKRLPNEILIKKSRDAWLNESFDQIDELGRHITKDSPDEAKEYYAYLLNKLGTIFAEDKQYEKAIGCFREAAEYKSDFPMTFYNWGVSLTSLAETKSGNEAEDLYQQAFEKYQKAIEIKPDEHETFNNWGCSLGQLAQAKEGKEAEELYQKAIDKYKKAVEIKPDYHGAYNNLGWTYFCKGDIELAEQYLLKSWDYNDQIGPTAMNIGHINLINGNIERALEMYMSSYELYNDKGIFWKDYDEDFKAVAKYAITKEEYDKMREKIEHRIDKPKTLKEPNK